MADGRAYSPRRRPRSHRCKRRQSRDAATGRRSARPDHCRYLHAGVSSGFELCEFVKRKGSLPVILTAGPVEAILTKWKWIVCVPTAFCANRIRGQRVLLDSVGRFVSGGRARKAAPVMRSASTPARSVAVIDKEQVRAAVHAWKRLDGAMAGLVDQIAG